MEREESTWVNSETASGERLISNARGRPGGVNSPTDTDQTCFRQKIKKKNYNLRYKIGWMDE